MSLLTFTELYHQNCIVELSKQVQQLTELLLERDSESSEQRAETSETCKWVLDEDGAWDTECGNRFEVTEGTPHGNNMFFCAFCGKRLEEE